MARLSFYMCFSCSTPYYGGKRDCGQPEAMQEFKKEDLVCGSCAAKKAGVGVAECKIHGKDAIEFKCRYCCSLALWFCFGTTHFCEPCHQRAGRNETKQCPGPGKCPLGMDHPPNGTEYPLGCGLCRNGGAFAEKPQPPKVKKEKKEKKRMLANLKAIMKR